MRFLVGVAVVLIFFSCKTQQVTLKPRSLKAITTKDFYDSIVNNYASCNNFYAKFNAQSIIDGNSTAIKGSIKIRRDSVIWISITPALGTEVFRVLISKDSIKYLNRLNREYYAGDYKYLSQLTKVDMNYSTLENIMLNKFFFYPTGAIDTLEALSFFEISKDPRVYKIQNLSDKEYRKKLKGGLRENYIYHSYEVNKYNLHLDKILFNDFQYQRTLWVDYSEFAEIEGYSFPEKIAVKIQEENKNMSVEIEYYKIEFDKETTYPFSISERYKRIIE